MGTKLAEKLIDKQRELYEKQGSISAKAILLCTNIASVVLICETVQMFMRFSKMHNMSTASLRFLSLDPMEVIIFATLLVLAASAVLAFCAWLKEKIRGENSDQNTINISSCNPVGTLLFGAALGLDKVTGMCFTA